MFGYDYAHQTAERIKKELSTKDPFQIARCYNITVEQKDMSIMGYYMRLNKQKWIFINKNLDYKSKKIVLAHELGHALMHDMNTASFSLFIGVNEFSSCMEYEANVFAAELLLNPEKLKKSISQLTNNELTLLRKCRH